MAESVDNCEKISGNVQKCLIERLILLESARNFLNHELNRFTEKTADEIKVFLNSPFSSHTPDGENLLKILDYKLQVFQKLLDVFTSFESDPHDLNLQTFGRSLQGLFVFNFLMSNQSGVFFPHVCKFGLLLQTWFQRRSISRTMQIFGSTPSLDYLISSIQSEQEPPCKMSCDYNAKNDEELKVNPNVSSIRADSETETKTKKTFVHHKMYQEFVPSVGTPAFTQQFEIDSEVQHQKQTSSQLVSFLKMNIEKIEFESPVLVQQVRSRSFLQSLPDQKFMSEHEASEKHLISEMKVSGPMFKVKSSTDGSLTYSCMIATHSELWDLANVSTGTLNCQQDRTMDFTDLGGVPEPLGPGCGSNSESFNSEQIFQTCKLMDDSVDRQKVEFRVPEFQIKKFEEMAVVVSHVISPSLFHIQHKEASLQELSDIMANANIKSYAERKCIPDIGSYVMGLSSELACWYRAQVIKICGMNNGSCHGDLGQMNIEVEIRRIDYGDTARMSLWNVKELCSDAAQVPAQALQVSLAEVNPVNDVSWSDEAISWFKDKVKNRTLYARLYPQTNGMTVGLFMEKGKIGAMRRGDSLSVRLAQNGHAKHNQMKNPPCKRSSARERSRKQSLEWEKYLISCYSRHRK